MNLYSVGFNSSCSAFKKHYNVILINQEMCWCTACCIYGVKGPQQKGESFIFVIISSTFLQTTDVHKVDICVLAYHLHIKCSSALTSWGWGGCWLSNGRSSSHTAGYLSVCLANQNWHFFFFHGKLNCFHSDKTGILNQTVTFSEPQSNGFLYRNPDQSTSTALWRERTR